MAAEFSPERRRLLVRAAGVAGLGAAAIALGCAKPKPPVEPPAAPVRVALARLPEGQRVVVMLGRKPVELVRAGEAVRARSLWCTHMGCVVRWRDEDQRYHCKCHEGVYDADGQPLAGPPPHPLHDVPVRRDGDAVVVGEPARPA